MQEFLDILRSAQAVVLATVVGIAAVPVGVVAVAAAPLLGARRLRYMDIPLNSARGGVGGAAAAGLTGTVGGGRGAARRRPTR